MDHRDNQNAVARAEDLGDLLNHIAWTDTLQPLFDKIKHDYSAMLVKSVLGYKVTVQGASGPEALTVEQLAARVDSIEWLEKKIREIIRQGHLAEERLAASE